MPRLTALHARSPLGRSENKTLRSVFDKCAENNGPIEKKELSELFDEV